MDSAFQPIKHRILSGETLSSDDAESAFSAILSGEVDPIDIAAFLAAMKVRGETADEVLGAVRVMRRNADPTLAPPGAIDTCGTGGDGLSTLNVSTTVAIVLAACGVPIAKHGTRSISSKSGSSDVLTALGVSIDQNADAIRKALADYNISFFFAPSYHAAMAVVAPVRVTLKARTIFNLLGPLSNPAAVKRQLLGTFDARWCRPMAEVLRDLGSEKAWVVHGHDGEDEISISGPTYVTELANGAIDNFEITPADAGLPEHPLEAIKGGDPAYNAAAMRDVLGGKEGAYQDAVALNAAAALIVADKVTSLEDGAAKAKVIMRSGKALQLLDDWAAFTQSHKNGTAP